MTKSFEDYYMSQAGSGLTAFQGYKYQRGHGFFGNAFRNILKPLGLYLGKNLLKSGVSIGNDLISGQNFKESLKNRLIESGENILSDSAERLKNYRQTGKGKKRKKSKKNKKSTKKSSKKIKSKRKIKKQKLKIKKKKSKNLSTKKLKRKSLRKKRSKKKQRKAKLFDF